MFRGASADQAGKQAIAAGRSIRAKRRTTLGTSSGTERLSAWAAARRILALPDRGERTAADGGHAQTRTGDLLRVKQAL